MPVVRDPFEVSPFEVQDFLSSLATYAERRPGASIAGLRAIFGWQEQAFASTDDSYCKQVRYQSSGDLSLALTKEKDQSGGGELECLTPAGLGWELFTAERLPYVREHSLYEMIDRKLAEIDEDMRFPVKPVDVGRYEAVFDEALIGQNLQPELLDARRSLTGRSATEANARGTSYLSSPLEMLGQYQAGGPLLTLTANRSDPGSAGWVQWDADGVVPDVFTLVADGLLVDFQTTREAAGWLAPYYQRAGKRLRSHGCSAAPEGIDAPLLHTPNLVLKPGRRAEGLRRAGRRTGQGHCDQKCEPECRLPSRHRDGTGQNIRRAKRGKLRDHRRSGLPLCFLSSGKDCSNWEARRRRSASVCLLRRGTGQTCSHSVTAPPALIKDITLINVYQKA